jgi:glycosyltransferase involved in cell wall biosynthesis
MAGGDITQAPHVTVLIGAYNNEATLAKAVESMLAQSVSDIEVLVVDDGSTDSTAQVAASLTDHDARVRLLRMPRNVGIARSLNAGMRAAKAPVIAVQDADDWSDPRRLERQLVALNASPDIAVVGCRMAEVDERGNGLVPRTSLATGDVSRWLMHFNPIPNSAAAFRRSNVLEAGGYDPRYRWATEYDLWLRLSERYRIVALDEILATRRMSTTNVAATHERAQTAETIHMRVRAMWRRRSVRGANGLLPYAVSYLTPTSLKRARRRRLGQAL